MRLPQTRVKKARIEIIPMIDAIFFLLVYFMYSSLSMVKMNGLPLTLPKAPTADSGAPTAKGESATGKPASPPRLILNIPQHAGVQLGGETLGADATLGPALTDRLRKTPGAVIVVRVADGVSAQRLVTIMDSLNGVSLPDGTHPQFVVATVAAPPTDRSNVSPEASSDRNAR